MFNNKIIINEMKIYLYRLNRNKMKILKFIYLREFFNYFIILIYDNYKLNINSL